MEIFNVWTVNFYEGPLFELIDHFIFVLARIFPFPFHMNIFLLILMIVYFFQDQHQ